MNHNHTSVPSVIDARRRTVAGVEGAAAVGPDDFEALLAILQGTMHSTGDEFFQSLVRHLTAALGVPFAAVAEFADTDARVRTLAYWAEGHIHDNFEYELAGTPCQDVVRGRLCHHPAGVRELFPRAGPLVALGVESYLGVPLLDGTGKVLGVLAVFDRRPMPAQPRHLFILRLFATRASAELERLRGEQQRARLQQQNLYLQEEIKAGHNFDQLIGQSAALLVVLDNVRRVAPTDASVLIRGETGTGKELIARAIHFASKRRDKPLIKVNCAALPSGLVESELFGHEKGAFSGAIARRIGRFELAHGGTIFLDEIGEIPPETQVKLLRVLQEHEIERVGGSGPIQVDVRVLAATNRDLLRAVQDKIFREDLFYRLNVFPIQLPPLRERPEDIPLLVQFLVNKFAAEIGKHVSGVSARTLQRLVSYPWPGNIRELENVLERAVILTTGPTVDIVPDLLPTPEPVPDAASPHTLETVERDHILAILQRAGWIVEGPRGAAKILGLHPNTLRNRLKKLGIQRPAHQIS